MPRQESLNSGIHAMPGREDRQGHPYYRLRYRDRDGHPRWAGLGRGTNRELNQRADDFLRGLDGGQDPVPRGMSKTVSQAWTLYEADRLCDLQKSTRQGYKSIWRKHLEPRIGELPVRKVSKARLREVLDETTVGLSGKTRAHIIEVMKAFLGWCVEHGLASHNPAGGISKGNPEGGEKRSITGPKINAVLDELGERTWRTQGPGRTLTRDQMLVYLLSVTGLRFGEALALQWQDFMVRGWRASEVHISRDFVRGVIGPPKTKMSIRTVPLTGRLRDAIQLQYSLATEQPDFDKKNYVFSNGKGKPLCGDDWRKRVFTPAAKRAHVDFTIKDLRDYAITQWVASGTMNLLEVQTLAGHTQPQTTMRYFRNDPTTTLSKGRKAAENMGW